ncbi:hypothetical protein [Clostridium sp. 001]|uniref:hypothetical protein n=1 Tax=Clostridium sp. 001 TaxID=1970093 RepID=UPI001C2BFD07|nr:hypothetical protein [Clostridium sp. 001]QXE17644.1 hypothetical protein B5S50_01595 [Clostridium sp. 001]
MDIYECYKQNKFVTLEKIYDENGSEIDNDLLQFLSAFSNEKTLIIFGIFKYGILEEAYKFNKNKEKYNFIINNNFINEILKNDIRMYLNTKDSLTVLTSENTGIVRDYSKFEKRKDIIKQIVLIHPNDKVKFKDIKSIEPNILKKFTIYCTVVDSIDHHSRFIDVVNGWNTLNDEDEIWIHPFYIKQNAINYTNEESDVR